jgi:hypothetical protein
MAIVLNSNTDLNLKQFVLDTNLNPIVAQNEDIFIGLLKLNKEDNYNEILSVAISYLNKSILNTLTPLKKTYLSYAFEHSNIPVIEILLEQGAKWDGSTLDGFTLLPPIFNAVYNENVFRHFAPCVNLNQLSLTGHSICTFILATKSIDRYVLLELALLAGADPNLPLEYPPMAYLEKFKDKKRYTQLLALNGANCQYTECSIYNGNISNPIAKACIANMDEIFTNEAICEKEDIQTIRKMAYIAQVYDLAVPIDVLCNKLTLLRNNHTITRRLIDTVVEERNKMYNFENSSTLGGDEWGMYRNEDIIQLNEGKNVYGFLRHELPILIQKGENPFNNKAISLKVLKLFRNVPMNRCYSLEEALDWNSPRYSIAKVNHLNNLQSRLENFIKAFYTYADISFLSNCPDVYLNNILSKLRDIIYINNVTDIREAVIILALRFLGQGRHTRYLWEVIIEPVMARHAFFSGMPNEFMNKFDPIPPNSLPEYVRTTTWVKLYETFIKPLSWEDFTLGFKNQNIQSLVEIMRLAPDLNIYTRIDLERWWREHKQAYIRDERKKK